MAEESSDDPIGDYLRSIDVGFTTTEGGVYDYKIHKFGYTGKSIPTIDCSIHFGEGGRVFTVFGMVNNIIPKKKINDMLQVINTANQLQKYGTMILDTEEGRFWTRHSNASINDVDPFVFDSMIRNVCNMMDDFYPLIMKVTYGDKTVKETIDDWWNQDSEKSVAPIPTDISGYQ